MRLDLTPARVAEVAAEAGITFCFATVFHPSMRHAAVARGQLGVPTAFNFLGPLTNPARPSASAVGVADLRMAPLMAGVLAERGGERAGVPGRGRPRRAHHLGPSTVWEVRQGQVVEQRLDPAEPRRSALAGVGAARRRRAAQRPGGSRPAGR